LTTPFRVDVDDAIPVLGPEIVRLAAHADAGVVEHEVEAALPLDSRVDDGTHGSNVAHVERNASD